MKKSLIIGKRQILLAALVVILAVAVYLNWQFSKSSNSGAVTDVYAGGHIGEAVLVDSDSTVESTDGSHQNDYFTRPREKTAERPSSTSLKLSLRMLRPTAIRPKTPTIR